MNIHICTNNVQNEMSIWPPFNSSKVDIDVYEFGSMQSILKKTRTTFNWSIDFFCFGLVCFVSLAIQLRMILGQQIEMQCNAMHEITNSDAGKVIAVIRSNTLYFEMEFIFQLEFDWTQQRNKHKRRQKKEAKISPQMHDKCVAIFFFSSSILN